MLTPEEATVLIQLLDTVQITGHENRAIMNHLVSKLETIRTFEDEEITENHANL